MDIIKILVDNLTFESKWLLGVLIKQNEKIPKEELWKQTNEEYRKQFPNEEKPLIKTRHFLDTHITRLEGAGLVDLKKVGQTRLYSISELGRIVLAKVTK